MKLSVFIKHSFVMIVLLSLAIKDRNSDHVYESVHDVKVAGKYEYFKNIVLILGIPPLLFLPVFSC